MDSTKFNAWIKLIRANSPIGTYLLLWPTWMSLWIAADGEPQPLHILVFGLGCFFMRSAGCAINDYADRKIDGSVERTKNRPLVNGALHPKTALYTFLGFSVASAGLVLLTNIQTILVSFGAVISAALYPFMKRYTHLPQAVLGIAFSFGIPMTFTANEKAIDSGVVLLWLASIIWVLVYDTFYAMVDRNDDLIIGVKSTAVLFAKADKLITAILQTIVLILLTAAAKIFQLGAAFYLGIGFVAVFFMYHQWLIKDRIRENCFLAFLNNHVALLVLFFMTILDTSIY